jgi:hypothetical protein
MFSLYEKNNCVEMHKLLIKPNLSTIFFVGVYFSNFKKTKFGFQTTKFYIIVCILYKEKLWKTFWDFSI